MPDVGPLCGCDYCADLGQTYCEAIKSLQQTVSVMKVEIELLKGQT